MKTTINLLAGFAITLFVSGVFSQNLKSENNDVFQKGQCQQLMKSTKPCKLQSDSIAIRPCSFEGKITQQEAKGLQFMYEEEKLARDVYAYLYEKYEMRVFGNITRSEQMHMSAIAGLMEGASVESKSKDAAGEFSIKHIQDLYDQLIDKGSLSMKDALEVGVLIEETDIKDLENEIASANNESIKQVYTNLLAASNRHLKAFNRNLERM